ncbi:Trans-aconitate 2-methyltransferase [Eubacteriaceae bacterium CHKCI005]|nr:Trans-aconitate 2-methyltransferase [Eubacteriaceae bacterium CHKCI005]
MHWNATLYREKHGFVPEYGKELLQYVNRDPDQNILDVGCGTGVLTNLLAVHGARVVGLDASEDMIAVAKESYPNVTFVEGNATHLPFQEEFDTVFSNAVFHWIQHQAELLDGICRALRPGGRLVCELGAQGNTQNIQEAFWKASSRVGVQIENRFFFPSTDQYEDLLVENGFVPERVVAFDRPTPLAEREMGLRNWMTQFLPVSEIPQEKREEVFQEVEEELKPRLWKEGRWIADYRRLRVVARKA